MAAFGLRPRQFSPSGQPLTWRIRTSLALLVLACLLPGALMSTYFIVSDYRQSKAKALRNVLATARAAVASLDRDLASIESGLRVLASANPLMSDDLPDFYLQAHHSLPYQNITNYVLIDRQGHQRLNTLLAWGSPMPQVGNPPQLQQVFTTGQAVLTDLFIGPVTRKPILALGVPVERGGEIIYSLNAGLEPERIGNVLKAQVLPKEWISAVIDGQGKIVARTKDPARYLGRSVVPDLIRKLHEKPEGFLETASLEGIPVVTAYSRSAIFNWTVAVGIPREELTRDLKESLGVLLLTQALIFAGALWLAWRVALSRVVVPADRLLERMNRISQGQDTGSAKDPRASFEFVALDEGFTEMSDRLKARDHEREVMIKRLVDTLESINDGFYLLDSQWRFAYVNRRAEALLGLPREALLGQDHWTALPMADAHLLRSAYERAVAKQEPTSLEVKLPSLGLWLDIHAYPSDHGLAVYFQDVSELRAAQHAREAQRMAEASNRAKTEFLSRMSHELRTPLNAVLGFTQVLQMDKRSPMTDHQQVMLTHIESSGKHLLEMITDVLDVSRIEAGTMEVVTEDVDIAELVHDCQLMVAASAEAAGVRLETGMNLGLHTVLADTTRLRQVLLNLLSNAIKYNRPGGSVTLAVEQAGDQVQFTVRDTGIGLTADQLQHLFEPFNRLGREQSSTPGTGIGLVICKRLVEMMGGQLAVSSVLNEGSCFSFKLPQHHI